MAFSKTEGSATIGTTEWGLSGNSSGAGTNTTER